MSKNHADNQGGSDPKGCRGADSESGPGEASSLGQVESIFFEVSAMSPADRDEGIVRLSKGDAALEREVRSLVGSAIQLGSYLEQPALGRDFDAIDRESRRLDGADELIGVALGPFTIERRIASGGMGTVYAAARSDGQFQQRVAVKVVKRGMDSEEILRRFAAERQVLAGLDHPNIARLLDGGVTPDGRPFVVMELIDGKPIDAYCDQFGLGLRDRLKLFREICAGVQHAHQNLVIHRDIKPSNIVVTPKGVPKLLDFGIAKVIGGGTDARTAGVTADTDRRLTPEYASPEQVEGGTLTTASDVYSLGVVLYELLTGTRPYHFGMRTHEEVRRVVCTQVPRAPSQAITVRADRLKTDGLGSGTLRAIKPAQEPTTATNLESLIQAGSGHVDLPKTRGVSSTRLRGLLRGDVDTIVLMALRKEPGRRYVSAEQLSADIGRFLDGLPVQARRDTLGYRASKFVRRHALGVAMTAACFTLLCVSTFELYRQRQTLRSQKELLVITNRSLDQTNRGLSESRRFLRTVIGGAAAGSQGPSATLADVVNEVASTLSSAPPKDLMTRAAAEQELGRAMMSLGMLDRAAPLLESARRAVEPLARDDEARLEAESSLGELSFYRRQYAEADGVFTDLLARERALGPGLNRERESMLLNNLGACARAQGQLDRAIAIQREALVATVAVFGPESLDAAETRNNLASVWFQKADFASAVAEFRAALSVRQALLRADHPLVVRCQSNLGLALLRSGSVDEAVQELKVAAQAWERAFGPEHAGRVAAMTSLAQGLDRQGHAQEAISWLKQALAWQQAHQADRPEQLAATEANIGVVLAGQRDDAPATEILERTLPVLSATPSLKGITQSATQALAGIYDRGGQTERAAMLRAGQALK